MSTQVFGSQRLLQRAVNHRPELLLSALRRSGAIGRRESLRWISPLRGDNFSEYRDSAALSRIGIAHRLRTPLNEFWPARGPVWDGLGIAGERRPLLLEAKAHIPETASPATRASQKSRRLIEASLGKARRFYAPRSGVDWSSTFFQYANRLAYQFYLRELNDIQSTLVFLYFTNAVDMDGPTSEAEWHGAVRLIHALMGLPADLGAWGVYDAFIDARLLTDAGNY